MPLLPRESPRSCRHRNGGAIHTLGAATPRMMPTSSPTLCHMTPQCIGQLNPMTLYQAIQGTSCPPNSQKPAVGSSRAMHPNCRVDHRESRNPGVKKDGFCVPVVLFVHLTLGGTASLGSDMFPRGILDSFVQNDLARETGGRRDPPGWGLGQIMIPLHWIIVCRLPTGPVAQYCFARHLKLGHGDRR